jgi:antitoxin component YwqK of YwqJK toxin-antitoxin module
VLFLGCIGLTSFAFSQAPIPPPRPTNSIPPPRPTNLLDWSDFTYNSPEENAFWDKLPEWSNKRLYFPYSRLKRNARGETIDSNSSEGFNGYVRRKAYTQRTIYQFVDGYVVRSKTLNKGGKKRSALNYKNGERDGIGTWWYENGQKRKESTYKEGKLMTSTSWKPNGEKCPITNILGGNGVNVDYGENGQKDFQSNYKDGKKNGLSIQWWHKDGRGHKWIQSNFKDGKRDGLLIKWFENGQKEEESTYKDEKLDGLSTKWYENGQKKEEINYKDGKKDGLSTWWYENGQKREQGNHKDDKRSGLWTEWYENGQKKLEINNMAGRYGHVVSGQIIEVDWVWTDRHETEWYDNGQKKEESARKDGKLFSLERWKANGEKYPETNLKDGNGFVVNYHENGKKKEEFNYKDGKQDGLWAEWYENGQQKLETNYKDGKQDGLRSEWYENGQQKLETKSKDGKLSDIKVWLPDGKECPESKVIDGLAIIVFYDEFNGGVNSRLKIPQYVATRQPLPILKLPASPEANSSKPTPPSLPPWLKVNSSKTKQPKIPPPIILPPSPPPDILPSLDE